MASRRRFAAARCWFHAVPRARWPGVKQTEESMPKMKTHRASAKRMRVTGSGRVRRGKSGSRHLMRGKPARRLRNLRKNGLVSEQETKRVKRLLPYEF
jgi:large subunit ribosomal protein L35